MIKHLLIMTTYGQIFYSQEFVKTKETVDVALTGGLMSAIYSMASETQREKISEFELVTTRVIFKEEKNELLFILTVDRRMDLKDTEDLLKMIAKRFFEKYGEIRIDGLVLTEFEEDVTEIVNKKLWYLETKKKKFGFFDYVATLLVTAILGWYSYVLFNMSTFIWGGILERLSNWGQLLLYILFLIGVIGLPAVILYLLTKHTKVNYILRFIRDYIGRPTRASYAELLPNYFLITLLLSFVLYFCVMIFAQGFFSEIKAYPIYPGSLLGEDYSQPFNWLNPFAKENYVQSDIPDQLLLGTITWVTWVIVFPLIYSLILGERNWLLTFRNAVFITSISIIIMLFCLTIGGTKYLTAVGLNPHHIDMDSIKYQLFAIIPLNIFFYGFLLFLGIGINRITPPKTKVPSILAIWASVYLTLIMQRLIFWLWAAPA